MVYSRPSNASGEIAGRKVSSYQARPLVFSPMSRESTPANNGMPRKTSTEVAMDQKENSAEVVASPSQEGRIWR